MESSNFIVNYLADISDVKKRIRELENLNKSSSKGFSDDFTRAVNIVDRRIKSISSKPVFDRDLGRSVVKTFAEIETVFKGTDGQLKTLRETSVLTNNGLKKLRETVTTGGSGVRTFSDNIKNLAKQAALTIPVWLGLRNAILGTIRNIREGATAIIDFDGALQKARFSISGTASQVETDFKRLREEATRVSIETGKSTETIVNAFQKFATVGFDFETSLRGALDSTKASAILFGDAEQTANAFARSLRVLVDESEDAAPVQEQIASAIAQTVTLFKNNAFELNEFTESLEKFA